MKFMSREFTKKEKIMIVLLLLILAGLSYYRFFFIPVQNRIATADTRREAARMELSIVEAQIARLQAMQDELDGIESAEHSTYLASYNNSEAEIRLLNRLLADTLQYSLSFSNVTRDEDLIRRNITMQFKTTDYNAMRELIENLIDGEFRCLIGDMRCSTSSKDGSVTATATVTFYETMVDGTPDDGLPVEK